MHPIVFFLVTLAIFSIAALLGQLFRVRRSSQFESEELSVKTLLGASLGLFGVLLGFTFSMANSRFEERRQLEITEATNLQTLWYRTSFLPEPARSEERTLLRQYLPERIQFFDAAPNDPSYKEDLRQSALLQNRMWKIVDDASSEPRNPATIQFNAALSDSIQAAEKRTAASENRLPVLSWAILLLLGSMACVLLGVDLRAHSYLLRGMLQVALAAALVLTYDIDTPRVGFVQVRQRSMVRVQHLLDGTAPVDQDH
jgi:hypothetical protein